MWSQVTEYFFNGRILQRPPGGVRRYAAEVSSLLGYKVLAPPSARYPWSARTWEQTLLAARTRHGVLLGVAHSAPLAHPRSVVVIHDLFALTDDDVRASYQKLMQLQVPRVVQRAAAIVTVSSTVADDVAERFQLDRTRISIARPGISEAFCPGDQEGARKRLGLDVDRLTIGALLDPISRKRIDRSVDTFTRLRAVLPDAQVIVASRDAVPAFAQSSRPVDSAGAKLFVDPTDSVLADLYRASDVVICSSDREGFGLAPVEAAACGAAVISPAVPSIHEFAPDAAVVVEPNVEAMVSAAIELAGSDERRTQQRRRGQNAVSDLKWAHTAATLDQVCRSVGE